VRPQRVAAAIAAATLVVASGWASSGNRFEVGANRPIGALGPGFFDPWAPPPPEGMIRPRPGSWDAVRPPRGYRVVLLTAGNDHPTTTLVTAVKHWANAEHVRLETVAVTEPRRSVDGIVEAMDLRSDLVICAGNALVDALALVTASHLDQQFLVVGAQLPEPTVNVTAAIWRGASSRGREVPNTDLSFDPDAFTPGRAGRCHPSRRRERGERPHRHRDLARVRSMRRSRWMLSVLVIALVCAARPAVAHPVPFSYVDIDVRADMLDVTVVAHVFDLGHDLNVMPRLSGFSIRRSSRPRRLPWRRWFAIGCISTPTGAG
jgi:hypothetical protein